MGSTSVVNHVLILFMLLLAEDKGRDEKDFPR